MNSYIATKYADLQDGLENPPQPVNDGLEYTEKFHYELHSWHPDGDGYSFVWKLVKD